VSAEACDPRQIMGTINTKVDGFFSSLERQLDSLRGEIESQLLNSADSTFRPGFEGIANKCNTAPRYDH
jgi:hypothetical protein